MDFLKKQFEKVALAAALLLLIVAAVYLALQAGNLTQQEPAPLRKGEVVQPVDVSPYSNALDMLRKPTQWTSGLDMFRRVQTQIPDQGPATKTNLPTVVRIVREPFKLLFKAYSWNTQTQQPYNIQINLRDFRRTYFVPAVGDYVTDPNDRLANTGYKITKYERKITNVVTNVGQQDLDISEITLWHENEKPIVLVLGREAEEQEPVATIMCWGDTQARSVRRGDRFGCAGATYIVVDINSSQMIIVDTKSEEKQIIPLSR